MDPEEPEDQPVPYAPYVFFSQNTGASSTETSIVNNASPIVNPVTGVLMKVNSDSACVITEDKKHIWSDQGDVKMWCIACGNWAQFQHAVSSLTAREQAVLARIQEAIEYYNPDGRVRDQPWPASTDQKQIIRDLEAIRDMFDE